jgi:plastocyanin
MQQHSKSICSFLLSVAPNLAVLATGFLLTGCGAESGHTTTTPGMSTASADAAGPKSSLATDQKSGDANANVTGAGATTAAHEISIDNFTFSPQILDVPVGATITWINRDDVPHTIVDADKRFKSAALDTDDRFSFTFTTAGEYPYFCGIHTHMTGKIIVK